MSRRADELHPVIRAQWETLRDRCDVLGIDIFLTCTLRTPAEQEVLYARGRTAGGPIVTHARAWESWHQPWADGLGLAFDIAFRPPGNPRGATWRGPWDVVGALAEWGELEWGGRWTGSRCDRPHFQNRLGRTRAEWRREAGFE